MTHQLIYLHIAIHIAIHRYVYQLMGVFCDRLKLCSKAAPYYRTGQNKGRYREQEFIFLLVSLLISDWWVMFEIYKWNFSCYFRYYNDSPVIHKCFLNNKHVKIYKQINNNWNKYVTITSDKIWSKCTFVFLFGKPFWTEKQVKKSLTNFVP